MKVSRNDLKALVKECLIELLEEGLGSSVSVASAPQRVPTVEARVRRGERMTLSPAGPSRAAGPGGAAMKDAIKREAGGNPVLAGIFEDTARTTLPRMIEGDMPGHVASAGASDVAARVVAAHAPEQLFGAEVTDKWVQLAFTPSRPGMRAQVAAQLDS